MPRAVRVRLLTASLEDDTEFFTRFGLSADFPERSLTFSFASLKLLNKDLLPSAIAVTKASFAFAPSL